MTVGTKLASGRTLNMLGGTLVCVGYIISSRAEDIRLLLLSYGVIQGNIIQNTRPKIASAKHIVSLMSTTMC